MALLTNINGKFSVSDAGAVTFNNAFTFPTTDGTANYILKTNGSGQLAWAPDSNSGDITGSGTANTVTKFTGAKVIGDGPITFSSNDSTFAGNVGIGTGSATLDEIFEIKSGNGAGGDPATNAPVMKITNNTTSSSWVSGNKIGGIEYWTRDPSGNAPYVTSFINSINDQSGTQVLPSGALVFGTATYNAVGGAVERMRIDSSGNVGIGTTDPSAGKLVVNSGTTNVTSVFKSTDNQAWVSIQDDDSGTYGALIGTDSDESENFVVANASASKMLSLNSSGSLKLHNYDGTNQVGTPTYLLGTDASGNVLKVLDGGGTVTGSGAATQVAFWDGTSSISGNNNLYWDSTNDHLGIGDSTPGSRLKVTSGVNETSIYTVDINHVRNNPDVATHAMRLNVDLSGADNTTADRTNSALLIDIDSSANGDASNEHRLFGVNAILNFTGFSDIVRGGYFIAESNYNGGKTAQLVGVYGQATHDADDAAGGVSNMYGVYGYSSIQDTGDVDNAYGVYGLVGIGDNRVADVGVTKAVEGEITIDKSTAINYGNMIGISSVIDNNEGSVPNFGTQYLFKGDYQGTKGANAYGIWTEGDKNYFTGNVGIGVTSPAEKLHVNSGTGNVPALFESTDNLSLIIFKDNNTTTDVGIGADDNDEVFYAGGSERMRIDSSGNVGIGNTNPSAFGKFVVQGAGNLLNLNATSGKVYQAFYENGVGRFYLNTLDGSDGLAFTDGDGSTERMRIDSSGNVLIGKTTNTISGAGVVIRNAGEIFSTREGDVAGFNRLTSDGNIVQFYKDGSVIGAIGCNSSGGNPVLDIASSSSTSLMRFLTSNSERMRIDSSGNVGIGTTNPTSLLTIVDGNVKIVKNMLSGGTDFDFLQLSFNGGWSQNVGGLASINFTDSITASNTVGRIGVTYTGSQGKFVITDLYSGGYAASGDVFTVQASGQTYMKGNVGIGTTSPARELEVQGGGNVYIRVTASTNNDSAALELKNTQEMWTIRNEDTNADALHFNSDDGTKMVIQTGGNVGIGTTSPSGLLHIKLGSINVFHANSVCGNVGIKLSNADITSIQDAAFTVKGNMSYAYTNYTQVAFTYTNVIDFNGFPAGVYQLNLCTQSNASSYGVFTIKWSGSAGTVINTLVSGGTNGGYGLSFSGTVLRSISNVDTDTAANLQCLVTYEACQV